MTHHDLDPRDELASAHLDGRTTPDQAAEIEADPELRARVAAMAAGRDALRAPVVVDAAARERAIGAALAAAAPRGDGDAVVDLSTVAARRRAPSRRLRIVGIAAALVLLALAVPLLAQLGDDSSDQDMAATAPDTGEERASDDAASAGGDAAEEGAETEAGAPSAEAFDASAGAADRPDAGALGTFDDPAALVERVESLLVDRDESGPAPATSSSRQLDGAATCADRAEGAGEAGSAIVLVATAVLDDLDVELTVVARPDDRRTMTVAAAGTCERVLTTDIDR